MEDLTVVFPKRSGSKHAKKELVFLVLMQHNIFYIPNLRKTHPQCPHRPANGPNLSSTTTFIPFNTTVHPTQRSLWPFLCRPQLRKELCSMHCEPAGLDPARDGVVSLEVSSGSYREWDLCTERPESQSQCRRPFLALPREQLLLCTAKRHKQ